MEFQARAQKGKHSLTTRRTFLKKGLDKKKEKEYIVGEEIRQPQTG